MIKKTLHQCLRRRRRLWVWFLSGFFFRGQSDHLVNYLLVSRLNKMRISETICAKLTHLNPEQILKLEND